MISDPDPWDLLVQCIETVNDHTAMFQRAGDIMESNKKTSKELFKQNQMLLKNIKVLNQSIKLINQRLCQLEQTNDPKPTSEDHSQ